MAVSRDSTKKSPSQAPKDFFACEQSGGAHGAKTVQPDKSASGPLREQIYGRKDLGKK